jgi:hypothetical protein
MNPLRAALVAAGVFSVMASAAFADDNAVAKRSGVSPLRKNDVSTCSACPPSPGGGCTGSYSVEIPVVARVQGTAFFRTQVAITNNSSKNGVTATYQFSYTCISGSCSPVGGFYRTNLQTITLPALGSFTQDDFVDYMNSQGLLQPGADQGTIGTLLVNFDNLPSCNGWEANAIARTYNRIAESDPTQGTVGFAYNASLFFDSAHSTLVGFARDTKANPTIAGKLRSNLGVRNTDICGANTSLTVDISFYDTATGQRVGAGCGAPCTFANLLPGETRQISDIWATANIDPSVHSVIVFVDARTPSLTTPTMEGYITIIDGQNTQDAALFTLLCGD